MVKRRYSAVLGALLFCPEDSCLSLDPEKNLLLSVRSFFLSQVLSFQLARGRLSTTWCDISPPRRLGVPCRLSSAFALRRVISPAASCLASGAAGKKWSRNGWRPPQSFCCFVGELWRCSACRLCTRCLRFACCSA